MIEHRCLRGNGGVSWEDPVSNSEVRLKVLGPKAQSLKQAPKQNNLWRMPAYRLSKCTLLSGGEGVSCRMGRGDLSMT